MTRVEESTSPKPDAEPSRRVIVGIDGSEASAHALRWAANKQSTLGSITPIAAYQLPSTIDLMTRPATATDRARYQKEATSRMTATISAEAPELLDRAEVIESHPGAGLVEVSVGADLLVVGTRGHNALSSALLGSISAYCVNHSATPVALIPPEWPASRPISTVVVGVDGSKNANQALRWVVGNLAPHLGPDGKIIAVGAFSTWAYAEARYDPPLADLTAGLEKTVTEAVREVAGELADGPEIDIRIESRDPRIVLPDITEAEGDLLVVGTRGVSGISHLLLGSVASALVHHPKVATVIVPAEPEAAATAD